MEVVFVRHGIPDYKLSDERKMTQLEKDYAPLNRDHIPDIQTLSLDSVFKGAQIIISSPYTRALQTAEIINRKLVLDLFVEHDLREWRADLDGGYIDLDERDRRWVEYRQNLKCKCVSTSANYETTSHLQKRVIDVLNRFRHYEKIVVVSHLNVYESLFGFQEQTIGCGGYRLFDLSQVS